MAKKPGDEAFNFLAAVFGIPVYIFGLWCFTHVWHWVSLAIPSLQMQDLTKVQAGLLCLLPGFVLFREVKEKTGKENLLDILVWFFRYGFALVMGWILFNLGGYGG